MLACLATPPSAEQADFEISLRVNEDVCVVFEAWAVAVRAYPEGRARRFWCCRLGVWLRAGVRRAGQKGKGGEDDILLHRHPAVEGMAPILKLMLLSDGSVTRHLQLLLEDRVMVDSVQTTVPEQASSNVPAAALSIPGPLVQRQVLLRVPSTPPLVYAASWWNASAFSSGVIDATKPVGASLREGKLETYREILRVFKGESDVVGDLLGAEGPFWGRQYLLWHKGAPLTCIYEVFSCALQKQLCPSTVVNLGSRRNGANGRNGVTRTATSE
eukprot:evm.model.scf_116.5 EVM.evm.TU.scf_116.5   scf_116:53361-55140(-)